MKIINNRYIINIGDDMLKLNNKGFAISTILYGLLILMIIILYLIFHIISTNNSNAKSISDDINEELNLCREERIEYQTCNNPSDCDSTYLEYKNCYCTKIYKDNQTCDSLFQ